MRMTETLAVRRRPGRQPRFSADDVVATATRIGFDTFSIAGVARELGVTTAAVYRRFPSHKALLHECLYRALTRAQPLTGEEDWKTALRHTADEWWRLCEMHTGLAQALSGNLELVSSVIAEPFASYTRPLVTAGFSPSEALVAATLLISVLNHVFRLPTEGIAGQSRVLLRSQAVDIIIEGIALGRTENLASDLPAASAGTPTEPPADL